MQLELFGQEPFSIRLKIDEAVRIFKSNYWDKLPYGKNSNNITEKIVNFFRGQYLDTISKADVERMRQFYLKMGYSESTVNKIHMTLSRIYTKFAEYKEGKFVDGTDFSNITLPLKNPASLVPRTREKPKPEIEITIERKKILCSYADEDLFEIIDTLWWSMLRMGDLFSITNKNVNLNQGTICGVQNKSITTNNPNGLEYRVVIPMDRIDVIRRRIESTNPGTPLFRRKNLQKRWERARSLSGLFLVQIRDIRRTAATYLLDNGSDLMTVSKGLGHTTTRMTETYVPRRKTHLENSVANLVSAFE